MAVKVAFNGLGRIGRLAFRVMFELGDMFEIVHCNDVACLESSAYLLQFDSVHGTWGAKVEAKDGALLITHNDKETVIPYSTESSPKNIDYAATGADMVMECTGVHLTREKLQPYFDNGVKKVVVSAPVKDKEDPVLNIVIGCNEGLYDAGKDDIVTAASCTTNCLAPVIKVMHEKLGIVKGCVTTIHDVTNTQTVVDAPNTKKSDLRRARSALVNLAPTSTGSATAIALIFPELKGKLNGHAIRVPLTNSSITDVVLQVSRDTTVEEVNALLKEASETYLKGILGFETRPLVSTDYINDARSSIVDAPSTMVIDGNLVKIYAWYDNEYGYSCRMVDVAKVVAERM